MEKLTGNKRVLIVGGSGEFSNLLTAEAVDILMFLWRVVLMS